MKQQSHKKKIKAYIYAFVALATSLIILCVSINILGENSAMQGYTDMLLIIFGMLYFVSIIVIFNRVFYELEHTYMDTIEKEQAQQRKINKLKIAVEQAPVSIVITDIDGNIEYVNPWFCKITGYSFEEALGQNPRILQTGYTSQEAYEELWKEITHDEIWRGKFKNKKKNGDEYWEEAVIAPLEDENGNIINFIGVKQDKTQEIVLNEQLKTQEDIMIAQSRQAAMGEMLSMIAHQWRQPISVIAMGANNMIADIELDEINPEEFKSDAQDIIKQTQYLSKTIDDFRNFFRPNSKQMESIYLDEVIENALKLIGKSLENHDIRVKKDFTQQTYRLYTYPRELLQVFLNIFTNAKDAFDERAIEKRVITISVKEVDDTIILCLEDNAGGIDEAILSRIFEPYFSTKDVKNGTGLGLYMSKTIVEKHLQGVIKAYNKNEGACFEIELPSKERE